MTDRFRKEGFNGYVQESVGLHTAHAGSSQGFADRRDFNSIQDPSRLLCEVLGRDGFEDVMSRPSRSMMVCSSLNISPKS